MDNGYTNTNCCCVSYLDKHLSLWINWPKFLKILCFTNDAVTTIPVITSQSASVLPPPPTRKMKVWNVSWLWLYQVYVTFYFVFQAEKNVKRYGKVLMAEVPQETTELLKRLCTDYRPTDSQYIVCVFITPASSVLMGHYPVYLCVCLFVFNSKIICTVNSRLFVDFLGGSAQHNNVSILLW